MDEASKIPVFLDTNVYLHYRDFQEVQWADVVGAESVLIVVPPVVVRELRDHSAMHPQSRIRNRATRILRAMNTLFDQGTRTPLRDRVDFHIEDREPLDFGAHQLNPAIADDRLIASILMYRRDHGTPGAVLITSDLGLTLIAKARRFDIRAIRASDDLRLPVEPDQAQAKIRQLESELASARSRSPSLSVVFEDDKDHGHFVVGAKTSSIPEGYPTSLDEFRNKYPKFTPSPTSPPTSNALEAATRTILGSISPEEIERYNKELGAFHKTYEKYLRDVSAYDAIAVRTVKLELWLTNGGTAPADDIDTFLHFPDGFEVLDEAGYPTLPGVPRAPGRPRYGHEIMIAGMQGLTAANLRDLTLTGHPPLAPRMTIRRSNSYDVEVGSESLKHHMRERLDPIYIVFPSVDQAVSFQIEYRILAANVPSPVSGLVHVVIEHASAIDDARESS